MPKNWRGVIAQINTLTGDGRMIEEVGYREFPLTLRVQRVDDGGHSHAEPCGTITSIVVEGNDVIGEGTFSTNEAGEYAAHAVEEGTLRGVSVDPGEVRSRWEIVDNRDGTVYTYAEIDRMGRDEYEELAPFLEERTVYEFYEIAALTIVATPAFAAARIEVVDESETTETTEETTEEGERIAASAGGSVLGRHSMVLPESEERRGPRVPERFVASSHFVAPADAFARRDYDGYQRFTVDPQTRRIFGHIYPWVGAHRGCAEQPPQSRDFRQFLTGGRLALDNGETIDIGILTFQGGHAGSSDEYDRIREDPANQLGPVVLYADDYGVQACGIVWPDIDEVALARAAAAYPSGDWRMKDGEFKLMGVALVNNPGYHAFDIPGIEEERLVASFTPARHSVDRGIVDGLNGGARPLSVFDRITLTDLDRRMRIK